MPPVSYTSGVRGMNFYFCEACGKRVTEIDIEKGTARNKQLKGVYCTGCSEGVNTMTMLPITGVELLDTSKNKPVTASVKKIPTQRYSEVKIAPYHGSPPAAVKK